MEIQANDVIDSLVTELATKIKENAMLKAQIAALLRKPSPEQRTVVESEEGSVSGDDEGNVTRLPVEIRDPFVHAE